MTVALRMCRCPRRRSAGLILIPLTRSVDGIQGNKQLERFLYVVVANNTIVSVVKKIRTNRKP